MGGGGGSSRPNPILHPIKFIKSFFQGSSSGSSRVAETDSYNASTAELQETLRVSKALEEFRASVTEQSESYEQNLVSYCWEQMDEMMKFLHSINEKDYNGVKLKLNLKSMERENRELVDSIHGSVKKDVLAKVNIDNPECEKILLMNAGEEKRVAMKNFMDESIKKSLNNLSRHLKNTLSKQCDTIDESISARLSDITDSMNTKISQFAEFEKLANGDSAELEEKQLNVSREMAISGLWLDCTSE